MAPSGTVSPPAMSSLPERLTIFSFIAGDERGASPVAANEWRGGERPDRILSTAARARSKKTYARRFGISLSRRRFAFRRRPRAPDRHARRSVSNILQPESRSLRLFRHSFTAVASHARLLIVSWKYSASTSAGSLLSSPSSSMSGACPPAPLPRVMTNPFSAARCSVLPPKSV